MSATNLGGVWPDLELTQEEKRTHSPYGDPRRGLRGVVRRVMSITLIDTGTPGEVSRLSDKFVSSGRRVRLFAMSFSGDIEWWEVKVTRTPSDLISQDWTPVSALLGVPNLNGAGFAPDYSDSRSALVRPQAGPVHFDPNYVLEGSQSILVDGRQGRGVGADRTVLNVGFHFWEFM